MNHMTRAEKLLGALERRGFMVQLHESLQALQIVPSNRLTLADRAAIERARSILIRLLSERKTLTEVNDHELEPSVPAPGCGEKAPAPTSTTASVTPVPERQKYGPGQSGAATAHKAADGPDHAARMATEWS